MAVESLRRLTLRHGLLVALKYAVAAGVATAVGTWWMPQDVLSVIFIALICTRPALSGVFRDAWEQIIASLVGTAVALVVFSVIGQGPLGVGAAAAAAWALATFLRLGGQSVVIVLLSVAYLGYPGDDSWLARALLRESSLMLGVLVALFVNLLAAPWMGKYNLQVRFLLGIGRVRTQLLVLGQALQKADNAGPGELLSAFSREVAGWNVICDELDDLRRDARFVPGWFSAHSAQDAEWVPNAARELEQVIHHVQDVAAATRGLWAEPEWNADNNVLLDVCAEALLEGAVALEAGAMGDWQRAECLLRVQVRHVRELDTRVQAPDDIDARLGPQLWLMIAVAGVMSHLARLSARMGQAPPGLRASVRVV